VHDEDVASGLKIANRSARGARSTDVEKSGLSLVVDAFGGTSPVPTPMAGDSTKAIEIEGRIMAVLAGTMFRIQLVNNHGVLAHIWGKMRKRFIRLTAGTGWDCRCPRTT
jgi:translation initiation factor IF-1